MTALVTWADRPSVVSYSPLRQMCGSASRVPSKVGDWAPSIRSHWATIALISVGLKQHPHWKGYRERERQRGSTLSNIRQWIRSDVTEREEMTRSYSTLRASERQRKKTNGPMKLETSAHCLTFQDILTNKRRPSALAWELAWGGDH